MNVSNEIPPVHQCIHACAHLVEQQAQRAESAEARLAEARQIARDLNRMAHLTADDSLKVAALEKKHPWLKWWKEPKDGD